MQDVDLRLLGIPGSCGTYNPQSQFYGNLHGFPCLSGLGARDPKTKRSRAATLPTGYSIVLRVPPRASKGITDLLWPPTSEHWVLCRVRSRYEEDKPVRKGLASLILEVDDHLTSYQLATGVSLVSAIEQTDQSTN